MTVSPLPSTSNHMIEEDEDLICGKQGKIGDIEQNCKDKVSTEDIESPPTNNTDTDQITSEKSSFYCGTPVSYKSFSEFTNIKCSPNSNTSKVFLEKKNPKKIFELIDGALNGLLKNITPSSLKKIEKSILLQCAEYLVKATFGVSARIFTTGSAAVDIDSEMSDIDIVVFAPFDPRTALYKMSAQFQLLRRKHDDRCICCNSSNLHTNCGSSWYLENYLMGMEINVIDTAKVPVMIIRSKSPGFKTECDISINIYTSLLHSVLFQCVLISYPELRPVLRLIKYWLYIRKLPVARDGGMPCIVWLLLAFVHCNVNNNPVRSQQQDMENIWRPAKQLLLNLHLNSSQKSLVNTDIDSQYITLFENDKKDGYSPNIPNFCNLINNINEVKDISPNLLIAKEDNDYKTKSIGGTTFMALVSFFMSLWHRNSLSCNVSVISRNIQPKDQRMTSQIIYNNGGIWDEVLTLNDPSTSLLRQLGQKSILNGIKDDESIQYNLNKIEDKHKKIKYVSKLDIEDIYEWLLPHNDYLTSSDLAARVTCGTWLVYLYELRRGFTILETYLQKITIALSDFDANDVVENLFMPTDEEVYKIPAKLSKSVPNCMYSSIDLDFLFENELLTLIQVPYLSCNHKFCLVLLYGHIVILRIEKICVDWEGGWWSNEFLSRRDTRSVLHGSIFYPIPISFSSYRNPNSEHCILQPIDSRILYSNIRDNTKFSNNIGEVMVNPAVFITILNGIEWYSIDEYNGFYIIPIKEYYRFLDIEIIAKDSPYWHENLNGNSSSIQPLVISCKFCRKTCKSSGLENLLGLRNLYWDSKQSKFGNK
ncbi:hypothetical protein cand_005600 [Cryptosporidium andersoni]|uniref:Poly(A) RNA polymerase mitochondrial-like central palm domain-containing protein n=1 Tax=Cryptosporidium andersoni TaxID=117008 RepID=A0A1J4MPH3_9CRYT|nr:hypothetical protein cand_005600 [Cryptosporidium andersoni]